MRLIRNQVYLNIEVSLNGSLTGRYILARIPVRGTERILLFALADMHGHLNISEDKCYLYTLVGGNSLEQLTNTSENRYAEFEKLRKKLFDFNNMHDALRHAKGN